MAYNWQQAREEDSSGLIPRQKALRTLQLFGRAEKILSKLQDERSAEPAAHGIGNGGAEPRPHRACHDHTPEIHLPLRRQKSRWRNHHLTWHGENRALHGHEADDSPIAALFHPVEPGVDKFMKHPCA